MKSITLRLTSRWRSDEVDSSSTWRRRPAYAIFAVEVVPTRATVSAPEYADRPPIQIVAMLADQIVYMGFESRFYRIVR